MLNPISIPTDLKPSERSPNAATSELGPGVRVCMYVPGGGGGGDGCGVES